MKDTSQVISQENESGLKGKPLEEGKIFPDSGGYLAGIQSTKNFVDIYELIRIKFVS